MKNKMLNMIWGCAMAIALATPFTSCEDDLSSKELKIYTKSPTGGNTFKTQLIHPEAQGSFSVKMPVRSTRELVADATVHFTVDNSLIAAYNEANATDFQPMPEELFSLENADLKLATGLQSSTDSLTVKVSDVTKLRDEAGYLIPIRITSISSEDTGLEISSNMNVVYIAFDVSIRRMYNADSFDWSLMDRTDWTITPNSSNINQNQCNQLKDDNVRTGASVNRAELSFIIDLQSSKNVKGFRFASFYSNSYDISAMEVAYSDDNATWSELGYHELKPATGNAAGNNCGYQFVGLYDPIKARYLKITTKVVGTSFSNYTGVGEVYLYE